MFPDIRVAAGTYNESALDILSGITMTGGWDTAFTQRNPDEFVTVIDAGRAAFAMRSGGLDARQVIDGVTVRNGMREGLGGGAFVISGDNTVISNSVFVGNTSSARGGAIYATFSAAYGGRPVLSKNVVIGNRSFSANAGGGIALYPLYTQGQHIDVAVTDNYILGNRDFANRGGGFGMSSASAYSYNVLKVELVGNVLGGNRALSGGGAAILALGGSDRFDLLIDNNLFFGNTAQDAGGLLLTGVGHIAGRISGNTFAGNAANVEGGGGIRILPNLTFESTFETKNLISWGNINGNLSGSALATYSDIGGGSSGSGNISLDPVFRSGPMGAYYLTQDANTMSPAVNAGAGLSADYAQDGQTTDSALAPDTGLVDMGYHYPVSVGPSADPIAFVRIDPQEGDFGGSDWVLVRGKGFDPGATVSFGAVPATDAIYVSSTRLLAKPAAHTPGPVDVTITNPDLTTVTATGGYSYVDNQPPDWPSTVGLQQALSRQDCLRSAVLTWNPAVDAATGPVKYEIHREVCTPTVNDFKNPCTNTGYFSTPVNLVATTTENFYVDPNFPTGGGDNKYIYLVRALDGVTPVPNKEMNYSKRIVLVSKVTGDTTPPANVGETLDVAQSGLLDWTGAVGALTYRVYRQTTASSYATPASLVPFITLTTVNNDLDTNGVTDTRYTDAVLPAAGQIFFYKISALDICNNETRAELGP
jgi:predicted outer membrane repeat protein